MSKLHILLIPAYYPAPETPLAGPFMRDLAHAISRTNDVTVLAPWSPGSGSEELDGPVRVKRLPRPRRRGRVDTIQRLWALHRVLLGLRREGRRVDILHAHCFATGPVAVLVGWLHHLPVVITENASACLEGELLGYEASLARFAYRRASVVCPDSPLAANCLRELQPKARFAVVPEVVDIDTFAVPRSREPTRRSSRIVAVSNLEERKGLDYLIEAVRLLIAEGRYVELSIVGEGPQRPRLEAQAGGMPVRLLGGRAKAEISNLLSGADVFAMPTLADPFGIAPVEALAAGVPVVVTSAAGCAELIEPLGAKVIPPRDVESLRAALAEFLDNPATVSPDVPDVLRSYCGSAAVGRQFDAIYRSVARLA